MTSRKVLVAAATFFVAIVALFSVLIVVATRDEGVVHSYVIPPGTQAELRRGREPAGLPPYRLNVRVGDTLEVVNRDEVAHTYGFIVVAPGETARYTFRRAGEFKGACTVALHDAVIITVT